MACMLAPVFPGMSFLKLGTPNRTENAEQAVIVRKPLPTFEVKWLIQTGRLEAGSFRNPPLMPCVAPRTDLLCICAIGQLGATREQYRQKSPESGLAKLQKS